MLTARTGHDGPTSDHFDGRHFQNLPGVRSRGLASFLRWRRNRLLHGVGAWPEWIEATPGPAPPERVAGSGLRCTVVNHSTVLLQTAGLNILTDPIWSWRASPLPWLGPRRRRLPGVRFADLPPIDVVLISHNHYDHLDLPTLQALAQVHRPRFITGLGNRPLLEQEGIGPVVELDWWQDVPLPAGGVTCVPAYHFSARGLWDRNRTLCCGFVLTGASGPTYFAGDTGSGPHFAEIARRLGPPRLALLPIGAHLPRWFMQPVHKSPAEAVQAHRDLQAAVSVAIHFDTFPLADDAAGEALAELQTALAAAPADFRVPEFGTGIDIP